MPKRIIPSLDTTLDAQGASKSEEPTRNGLIAMTSVFVVTMVVNTMTTLTIIWSLDNIGNAIMAVPNLIELIILAWTVAAITKERLQGDEQRGTGGDLLTLNTDRYTLA